jgi:polyisoprenoid-binding protein YceI
MNTRKLINGTFLAGMLLVNALSGAAIAASSVAVTGPGAGESCSLFENGKIEKSVLATLLNAAKNGHMYRVQTLTSEIRFCVDSKIKNVEGSFKDVRGGIALNQQQADSEQAVIVINTESLETGSLLVKNVIKGEDFFDVEKYPEILFVSTGVEWTSPTKAVLKGNLTLHGVTKSVRFDVELTGAGGKTPQNEEIITVRATTTIKRSDYGMGNFSGMVNDAVKLCMSVKAKKYQA